MFTLSINQKNVKTTLETRQARLFMGIYKFSSKEFCDDMN
jgi:hypothetical protein